MGIEIKSKALKKIKRKGIPIKCPNYILYFMSSSKTNFFIKQNHKEEQEQSRQAKLYGTILCSRFCPCQK